MTSNVVASRSVALAACGVAAPLVFTAAAIAASINYPDYDHLKNFISELGATGAPGAAVMNFAGFLPFGLLMLAFALAVHRGIRPDVGGWLAPTVLALYGLAYIGVAFAPCDPGCQAATPSLHHRIHFLLGDFIVLAAVVGPFALYPRMAKDPLWRSLVLATLVLPATAWVILELSGVGVPGALRQRLWLLLIFIWLELVAVRLIRLGTDVRPTSAPQAAA
jgi:hypothetical membrane protein